jgi:hypothetical protein
MFKIISDNTTLGKQGSTINVDALDGLNVDALIEGGHIERVNAIKKSEKKEQE